MHFILCKLNIYIFNYWCTGHKKEPWILVSCMYREYEYNYMMAHGPAQNRVK